MEQEPRAHAEGHRALVAAAGPAVLDTRELEPAGVATTLRADAQGRLAVTDGPFLETKEAAGGYYLIEAGHLDEVLGLAEHLYQATAGHSGAEIRSVVEPG
ncbi:YciI family protein [Streptomyces sp. NPDC007901]|uniref:YciI family protein n=1 Tax=Streptomyces sp. NPDC007901 TaxID=3364785 RepID=UPI0036E8F73C